MKWIFKNPLTLWLKYTIKNKRIESKYKKIYLKIDYMCQIYNCEWGKYNRIFENCRLSNVSLGDFSFVAKNTQIDTTSIGKFCSIGPDCRIGMAKHPSNTYVSTYPAFYSSGKQFPKTFADRDYFQEYIETEIGNDVWIGANVIIPGGIKIGDGAIIAAGAVVTKDVPEYTIVGGVPAKFIQYRFNKDEIEFLLREQWWNRDVDWLQNNFKLFHNIENYMVYRGVN